MRPVLLWVEGLFYDLRFALRALRRDRAFTAAAIAMLALAIGLNATVFTVMEAMLFRGLPLARRTDRIVYLEMRTQSGWARLAYSDFEAWRAQAQAFEGLAFSGGGGQIVFRGRDGRSFDTAMTRLSANTFGLLGVQPVLGRDFVPADEAPGAAPVAIVSHHFWETRLEKRPDVVGSLVHVNGAPVTVIGVMPEGFLNVYEQNFWMPLAHTAGLEGSAIGRLKNEATLQGARAELDTINRRLDAADPKPNRGVPSVMNYSQAHMSPDAPMIYGSLWAGAWFVLLIACANLANLTLARTIGRWREFSTKIALGAGQRRMMRQVLLESLVLSTVAGGLGWWITRWSVRTWATSTASRYLALDYRVDSSILVYLAAISAAAALLCSLAPIVKIVQLNVGGALKSDARGATQSLRGKHMGAVLVAGQMALAIVLISGAGVLVRSLVSIVGAESGVRDPDGIVIGSIKLPSVTYPDSETRLRYFDRLEARLTTIPGVEQAALASSVPVNSGNRRTFEIEGRPSPPDGGERIQFLSAGSNYFRVVGVSPIAGRDFNDGDRSTTLAVAVVNEAFASTYFPGEQPLGRRLRVTTRNQVSDWRIVVGVVPNIMQGDPVRQSFKPVVYVPFQQDPAAPAWNSAGCCFRGANFLLRTSVAPGYVARAVRAEIVKLDPDVILEDLGTLKDSFVFDRDKMDVEHAELGKHAAVAPILAVIALLLGGIGLGAVIAHSVSQRTKEIGVRMAIGAAARDIRAMIFREGMTPVAAGMTVGLAASLMVNRLLQSQLVGVSPYDLMTMAGGPVVLAAVALLACQIPARRAVRIEPAVALRHD